MWWTIYMGLFAFFWWMWNLGINFYFDKHSLAVKSVRCSWALTVLSMHHVLIVQSTCAILLDSERTIFFLWQTLGVSAVFVLCALLCSELCSLLVHWECSFLTHTVHFLARLLYVRFVPFCVLNCMNCLSASSVCVWARLPVFVLLCFASCAVDFSAHPPSSSSVFYQAAQWVTLRRTNITSRSTFLRLHILLAGALFLKLPRDQSSLSELRDIVKQRASSLWRAAVPENSRALSSPTPALPGGRI